MQLRIYHILYKYKKMIIFAYLVCSSKIVTHCRMAFATKRTMNQRHGLLQETVAFMMAEILRQYATKKPTTCWNKSCKKKVCFISQCHISESRNNAFKNIIPIYICKRDGERLPTVCDEETKTMLKLIMYVSYVDAK